MCEDRCKSKTEKDLYGRYFNSAVKAFEEGMNYEEVQNHIKVLGKWEELSDQHARIVMLCAKVFIPRELKNQIKQQIQDRRNK